uniref:CCHC-type domain-containing protein n=1 Tax=Pogona vitticeps TaxID=103695 RepID=A0ABM5FW80_9SAUR
MLIKLLFLKTRTRLRACFPPLLPNPPPAKDEPRHSGAQRGAGGTELAGNQEVDRLREAMERQARLIENLTEQQILMARQMRGRGSEEERGGRNLASVRGSLVAGPAPIRIQKMTATDDPEAYLHTFERVATAAGWPRDQWTLVLIPCLTGLLQEVVDTLGVQEATRYDAVKNAILSTLNLTEETYRKRLRELKWKPGTHPRTVAQRMRANAMRWLKPAENDGERLVDAVVLEQLVQSLGTNAKNWVQKNNPKTLERAITLLEDFSNTEEANKEVTAPWAERQRPRGGEVSLSTSNLTAKAGTEMSGPARARGKGFEPFAPKPVRPITVDQRIYAPGTGWKEGKDGRPIYTPGVVGKDNKEGRIVCYSCGVPGHVKRNCPGIDCSWVGRLTRAVETKGPTSERWEIDAWVNGMKKRALIDTGCGTTLVRDLPGDKKDGGLSVRCIHGDLKKYQTMWATVKVGDDERHMKIGVVPGLTREMLLGRDWVGSRNVGAVKEGLQGDEEDSKDQSDFLQRTSREQVRAMQQDDASLREPLLAAQTSGTIEGEKEDLPWRTAHSERGACEGVGPSVPSPEEERPKDASGCTEGILVEIESEEELQRRPTEVCLVDEGGAEMDLIMWEEVKGEGDFAWEFSWLGEGELGRCTTRGVQTDWLKDAKSLADGTPGVQSLPGGGGLLPEPPTTCGRGRTYEPLEWRVSVFPVGYHGGGRRVIRPGPEFQQKPPEGDWARHPCCGTICAVRSAPLRPLTDRERFGPAPW